MVWLSLFMLPCVVGVTPTIRTPLSLLRPSHAWSKGDDDNDHHFSKTAYRTGASVPSASVPSASIPSAGSWFANGLPGRIECLDDGGSQAS